MMAFKLAFVIIMTFMVGFDGNITEESAVMSRSMQKKVIAGHVNEASRLFSVSGRDIWSIIYIESYACMEIRGSSGEYGLMQIMEGEFEKYGPKVNALLEKKKKLPIFWEDDIDKLNPRTNVLIGTYILSRRLQMFDNDIIMAAMSHNVGRGGTRKTIARMRSGDDDWYCFRIKRGIRVGRQINYARKFAIRARRMDEWHAHFGDIPDEYIAAFKNGSGEEICGID